MRRATVRPRAGAEATIAGIWWGDHPRSTSVQACVPAVSMAAPRAVPAPQTKRRSA